MIGVVRSRMRSNSRLAHTESPHAGRAGAHTASRSYIFSISTL